MLPDSLRRGYAAFRQDQYAHERDRWLRLADGQRPETMIIACCDSRAAPETIFGAGPGELFVVRNVANLVPPYAPDDQYHGTSAALEFALLQLRVKHVVIMGHGRCGGISAAMEGHPEPLSPGDFIGKWITMLEPTVASCAVHASEGPDVHRTIVERRAVMASLQNLRTFPCVKTLEERGRISLHGAWFDIALGELWALDEGQATWAPVSPRCEEVKP